MTLFTQKWAIVSFISPVPEGFEFSYKNWPRHITMVDVFSIDRVQVQALHEFLVQVASNQSPIELTPSSTTYFESNNDRVLVQLYQQQESLHALHTKLTTTLEADYHITFNNPE